MKNKFYFLMFFTFLLLMAPIQSFGHSALKSSTPSNGAEIREEIKEVTLEFNTNIEPLSTFVVKDSNNKEVEVSEFIVNGKMLKGIFAAPLDSGDFTVDWKIVGADGHVVDGTFTFKVSLMNDNQNSPGQTTEEQSATDHQPQDQIKNNNQELNDISGEEHQLEQEEQRNSILIPLAIIVAVIIIITLWMFKKRGKQ